MIAWPCGCHARHSRQVSTMGFIMSSLTDSGPAACSKCSIFGSLACHHRRCSLRSSLLMMVGVQDRRFRRLCRMLNRIQSGSLGVPAASVKVRRVSCVASGPLPVVAGLSVLLAPGSFSWWCWSYSSSYFAASAPLASVVGCCVVNCRGVLGCAPRRGGAVSSGCANLQIPGLSNWWPGTFRPAYFLHCGQS